MASKIEIPLFTTNYTTRLFKNLENETYIENYRSEKFIFDSNFASGTSGIFIKSDFKLNPNDHISTNSINLYENLQINETHASDRRLWTYLTHVHFWTYMKKDWAIDFSKDKAKIVDFIRDRYFLNTLNIRSLTHNGISRLWWYTHLTIDDSRKDKYELTKVLLSLQDIPVSLLERSIGSNSKVRKAVLEFLLENPEIKTSKNVQNLLKQVNLAGGVKNIPMLKLNEIKSLLNGVKLI
ncbi:hypothetical protein EB822_00665 [Flavobacteriaceae bacterium PRS1]|nr:hypothetical protein EB822_00665 [Flavobacteriaceae bacterium PRS1]